MLEDMKKKLVLIQEDRSPPKKKEIYQERHGGTQALFVQAYNAGTFSA